MGTVSGAEKGRGVLVTAVSPGSPSDRAGVLPGDRIVAVGPQGVEDLLDVHYLTGRSRFLLTWETGAGVRRSRWIRPGGTPLGIFLEPIRVRRCRNRCIFCFVHQLPPGLRRSLYVKDEDVRLSFLHGQYVTLTDATDEEIRKIVRYRLSPLYVSIHTTDPVLRGRMLGRPGPAPVLPALGRLVGGGIALRGQIVVCPGWNDREELLRTLRELAALRPALDSVAVVPVGLTAHRERLPKLSPVGRREARDTLLDLHRLNAALGPGENGAFACAADEYYLLAGVAIPGHRSYGGFPQIENGVGLVRRFIDEARSVLRRKRWPPLSEGGTVVSGVAPARFIAPFLDALSRAARASFRHLPVRNRLFGGTVTATGLLTGGDVLDALKADRGRGPVYLPSVLLRDAGDIFLDDVSPADIAKATGRRTVLFDPTPRGFAASLAGEKAP